MTLELVVDKISCQIQCYQFRLFVCQEASSSLCGHFDCFTSALFFHQQDLLSTLQHLAVRDILVSHAHHLRKIYDHFDGFRPRAQYPMIRPS